MINTFSQLQRGKKLYFASDFHLGVPDRESSLKRERKIIRWLSSIKGDAAGILLVGDIFDFWFEYKHTVPKGFTRFLGKLAELSDEGIPIVIFTGNHDMWMFDYLPSELNITIHRTPQVYNIEGKTFFIGHGDGLGPGDYTFKFYKKVFRNSFFQTLFQWLHPNIGMAMANYWSRQSKRKNDKNGWDNDSDWLLKYCRRVESKKHHDFYIFGHQHYAKQVEIGEGTYFNLGDWIDQNTYVEFADDQVMLKKFE